MKRAELEARLKGALFISSMMGRKDGAFAAAHGRGASMVQIGALIADAEDRSHPEASLLPLSQEEMVPVLKREVDVVREALGDTPIMLNAGVGDLESGISMARAFGEAGGDIFELNVHGGYGKLLDRGLLRAMMLPENRATLIEWLTELCRLTIPVVVKFWPRMPGVNFTELLGEVASVEQLFGIHFNVRAGQEGVPDVVFVREIRQQVKGLLLCSGYVTERADVDALLAAGADCVGVAKGVLDEPGIMARLSAEG